MKHRVLCTVLSAKIQRRAWVKCRRCTHLSQYGASTILVRMHVTTVVLQAGSSAKAQLKHSVIQMYKCKLRAEELCYSTVLY